MHLSAVSSSVAFFPCERYTKAAGLLISCNPLIILPCTTAMEPVVRLYIGGLPVDITTKQLSGRFASFGTLSAIELVPSKQQLNPAGCHGFAYVDFTPKDDQSLHRCLSLVRRPPEHFQTVTQHGCSITLDTNIAQCVLMAVLQRDALYFAGFAATRCLVNAVQRVQMAWRSTEGRKS